MIIGARFNGPAGSGNGGYTCGLVAAELTLPPAHVAQVTLRAPAPLAAPLRVSHDGTGATVHAGERLIAEAAQARLDDPPPAAVGYDQAVAASAGYPGFVSHPFPTCYVCGPARAEGDGLRIFPGPLPDTRTAAPWLVPDAVGEVTVWAALDCPGGWAITGPGRPYVLGRMAARVHALPPAGARCVVVGVVGAVEGRRVEVGTALYRSDRDRPQLLAEARSTWVMIK